MQLYNFCWANDLATALTVDTMLGFRSHKMEIDGGIKIHDAPSLDHLKMQATLLIEEFLASKDHRKTCTNLLNLVHHEQTPKKGMKYLKILIKEYLILLDEAIGGVSAKPCDRYKNDGNLGVKIVSSIQWRKGEVIKSLSGHTAKISENDEKKVIVPGKNDFSIMKGKRKKTCSQLWLGPAAFVNHDCEANCSYEVLGDDNGYIKAMRTIMPGEEITCYYGSGYFGEENCHCECVTCEKSNKGAFCKRKQSCHQKIQERVDDTKEKSKEDDLHESDRELRWRVLAEATLGQCKEKYFDERIYRRVSQQHDLLRMKSPMNIRNTLKIIIDNGWISKHYGPNAMRKLQSRIKRRHPSRRTR